MDEKDKLIASLRKQLREALRKCSALEQENALLSSMIAKSNSMSFSGDNNGIAGTFNAPVITNMGYFGEDEKMKEELEKLKNELTKDK